MTKERLLSSGCEGSGASKRLASVMMEANSVRGEERALSTERTHRDRRRRSKRATATLEGGRLHNLLGDCVQRV